MSRWSGCRLLIGPNATVRPCECEKACVPGRTLPQQAQRDWDDPFLDALEPLLAKYRDTKERRESLFMFKCLVLAKDLETCEALMRGEKVPKSRLDPEWAKAYGIR